MKRNALSQYLKECNDRGISYAQAQQMETKAFLLKLKKEEEKKKAEEAAKNSERKDG